MKACFNRRQEPAQFAPMLQQGKTCLIWSERPGRGAFDPDNGPVRPLPVRYTTTPVLFVDIVSFRSARSCCGERL